MHLNFGFVAICLSEKSCSPAGNVTFASLKELSPEIQRSRIHRVAKRNLENTARIMWFLRAHEIPLYRISANLIPLATHTVTDGWEWWDDEELIELGAKIGRIARENDYRISSHLPEVCGLTSPQSFHWMQSYLDYHERLFDLLDLDDRVVIVVHVGGVYGEKEQALTAARDNVSALNEWARRRIALENDDRSYTYEETLALAEEGGLRTVFDWHHHVVNSGTCREPEALLPLLKRGAAAWTHRPMKVHVSSPKNDSQVRAHADFVEIEFVRPFFELLTELSLPSVDVMVEAKQKDLALFRLRDAWRGENDV